MHGVSPRTSHDFSSISILIFLVQVSGRDPIWASLSELQQINGGGNGINKVASCFVTLREQKSMM